MTQLLHSMSAQLALLLRSEIARGAWVGQLPGERLLAEQFQASRKTVRAALRELRAEGLVETRRGSGSAILALPARGNRHGEPRDGVGLLLPRPLAELRQHTTLWVNRLSDMLLGAGHRLTVFHGRKYFAATGHRQLAGLTRKHPMSCWIVAHSTRFVQNWFSESGLPTVIAGSLHPGVSLPSVDIDHVALCRHAAATLLRAGHRRIALLYPRTDRAGDLESEEGFRQGCAHLGEADAPVILQHEDTAESVAAAVARLLRLDRPPTGLLVSNSAAYLAVVSCLAAERLRIPADLSVISRDEDAFLHHLLPLPCRYYVDPTRYAQQVRRAVLGRLGRDAGSSVGIRIMPEYRAGGSVARLAGA